MRRGSGIPPSEALNRADEWSFSLCCVAIFLLAVCGTCGSSLRDEPAMPFCVFDYARRSTLGDWLDVLSEFDILQGGWMEVALLKRTYLGEEDDSQT